MIERIHPTFGDLQVLESENPAVDVWAESDAEDDGWSSFWIVSEFAPGSIRELAYPRKRHQEIGKRGYDQAGELV